MPVKIYCEINCIIGTKIICEGVVTYYILHRTYIHFYISYEPL